MGFSSFKTSDTNQSISNRYSMLGTFAVKMLDDKGNSFIETNYEGYASFGGMDFYVLTAIINNVEYKQETRPEYFCECFYGTRLSVHDEVEFERLRMIGIDLYFGEDKILKPKLVTIECKVQYSELPDSEICKFQGYFY